MNIEPDIFDYLQTTSLEPHDDYTSEITYKDQKIIWNRLQEQDKEVERLHSIIKEVREYIREKYKYLLVDDTFLDHDERIDRKQIIHILEILEKVDKDNK